MQTSQEPHASGAFSELYHFPAAQQIEPFCSSNFQIIDSNPCPKTTHLSFNTCSNDQFFTLESSPAPGSFAVYDFHYAVNVSPPDKSSLPTQGSRSYFSDPHPSPDNNYGTPTSGFSTTEDDIQLNHNLSELDSLLRGPELNVIDSSTRYTCAVHPKPSVPRLDEITEMIPRSDLKEVLVMCARALSDEDMSSASRLMQVLQNMVSVSGDPIQRLGAYLLEGLRARVEHSGCSIYKSLKCEQPTSAQLLSYMHVLYQICPFWKFAYTSANVVIAEAMQNQSRIHIIDFQIAQGSQWVSFIQDLALWPGEPPHICITGVDDSQSTHARGGGLHIIGERLSKLAQSCNVPFQFHDAATLLDSEVKIENLRIRPGEAVAVNFPFVLHHMPDESVTTHNHRDQLLRLIKRLSPRVVTLVEQDSNTNTSAFLPRFCETLDYYTAMFEAIDAARPRDDKQRISAEQQCVARDIVNMIACEGGERVERHELLQKWVSRFKMAGFTQYRLSQSVTNAVKDMLKEYNENYRVAETDGSLYLGWKNRSMSSCSAWM